MVGIKFLILLSCIAVIQAKYGSSEQLTPRLNGKDYRGYQNNTNGGWECQRWDRQYPHKHSRTPQKNPRAGLRSNFCRNPDGTKTIWCYTMNPKVRYQTCTPLNLLPDYHMNVESLTKSLNGSDYRGFQTKTRGGYTCQKWNRQYPHKHSRSPKEYPINGLDRNYCRNPDSTKTIWCYTTNPNKRYDYCNPKKIITAYKSEKLLGRKGKNYRGVQSRTNGGWQCQRWDSQYPHKHSRTPRNKPRSGLESNFCRNPDGTKTIWCYTMNPKVRFQTCTPLGIKPVRKTNVEQMTKKLLGSDYRGFQTKTKGGYTCQRWDRQYPHKHSVSTKQYPINGLNRNYCRNPDSTKTIWCYTTNRNKRFDFCNPKPIRYASNKAKIYNRVVVPRSSISYCDESMRGVKDSGYVGCQTRTRSGRTCQAWMRQYPHKHTRGGNWFYGTDGTHNKCRNPDGEITIRRNPDGEKTIWCYTTDPSKRWEYCDPLPQSGMVVLIVLILLCCICGGCIGWCVKQACQTKKVEGVNPAKPQPSAVTVTQASTKVVDQTQDQMMAAPAQPHGQMVQVGVPVYPQQYQMVQPAQYQQQPGQYQQQPGQFQQQPGQFQQQPGQFQQQPVYQTQN